MTVGTSVAIGILENSRMLSDNPYYQDTITDAIDEVRALQLAVEVLEKQIEVYKLFAPPKKLVDILRINKDGQEAIKDFEEY